MSASGAIAEVAAGCANDADDPFLPLIVGGACLLTPMPETLSQLRSLLSLTC